MELELERLRDFAGFASAVATLRRSADALLLATSLQIPIVLADRIRSDDSRVRREAHHAAVAARNDELGIPNCDHLISDPNCAECQKTPQN